MPASVKMKEIMHAPQLDHIDHKFVAGLDLNAVSVLRKSGTWEQWHLDTARVRHGDDVYVLVGLTRHADGATYLKELATQVDALVASMD
jgi:beta-lactamase class A